MQQRIHQYRQIPLMTWYITLRITKLGPSSFWVHINTVNNELLTHWLIGTVQWISKWFKLILSNVLNGTKDQLSKVEIRPSQIFTSNVTSITKVQSASAPLFADTWHPMGSVITTVYCVAIIFHRRVWYCTLSLCYVCIWSSDIILIP